MTRGRLCGALLVLACFGTPLRAQISPGPLAQAHSQLEGTLQCVKCHGAGRKEPMTSHCLECHKEIAWLVDRNRGFHAGSAIRSQKCSDCHPDHAGREFNLIKWPTGDLKTFDHASTGWPLDGGHVKPACADCHKVKYRAGPAAKLSARQGADVGWVGLERDCVTCHEDVHHGNLGVTCTKCHVTTSWKTINKSQFDHDKTKYPLRGKHAQVPCEKCHDFSKGKVGSNPPFAKCTDCHKDDHAGTATLAGRVVDCASCHTVDGWRPSTYTVALHRSAKYALEGKHEQVKCEECHVKHPPNVPPAQLGTAGVQMRPAFAQCTDCHADDHGGQLVRRTDKGACNACHTVKGFKPSTYTVAMHATLRLKLEGRHAEIECKACHGPQRPGLPALPSAQVLGHAGVALTLKEIDCASCHVDPHKGRFSAGPRVKAKGCLACHDLRTFRPSTADIAAHAQFGFELEGAHRATPCAACHREIQAVVGKRSSLVEGGGGIPVMRFEAKHGCADCHETPHGRQFATRKDGGKCDACHGVDTFSPATSFDHTRDASFSTKGAHEHVPCNQCHPRDPQGKTPNLLIYKPVSGKCESCHAKESK